MAGKMYGNAKNDENVGSAAHGDGMSDKDGPHADDARNTPSGDRELNSAKGYADAKSRSIVASE